MLGSYWLAILCVCWVWVSAGGVLSMINYPSRGLILPAAGTEQLRCQVTPEIQGNTLVVYCIQYTVYSIQYTVYSIQYTDTIILSYSHTLILSYYHTLILSYSHTLILSYSHTLILSLSLSLSLSLVPDMWALWAVWSLCLLHRVKHFLKVHLGLTSTDQSQGCMLITW